MLARLMPLIEAEPPVGPNGPSKPDEKRDPDTRPKKKPRDRTEKDAAKATAKRKKATEKARKTRERKRKAEMKAAAEANKKERQRRKEALKNQRTDQDAKVPDKTPGEMVPAQIRHCMLALRYKRGKTARAAWNICRWAMTKYGYLKGPYRVNTKLPKAMKQTGKGTRRNFQHGMEKGPLGGGIPGTGTSKARKFDKMFKSLGPELIPFKKSATRTRAEAAAKAAKVKKQAKKRRQAAQKVAAAKAAKKDVPEE